MPSVEIRPSRLSYAMPVLWAGIAALSAADGGRLLWLRVGLALFVAVLSALALRRRVTIHDDGATVQLLRARHDVPLDELRVYQRGTRALALATDGGQSLGAYVWPRSRVLIDGEPATLAAAYHTIRTRQWPAGSDDG